MGNSEFGNVDHISYLEGSFSIFFGRGGKKLKQPSVVQENFGFIVKFVTVNSPGMK